MLFPGSLSLLVALASLVKPSKLQICMTIAHQQHFTLWIPWKIHFTIYLLRYSNHICCWLLLLVQPHIAFLFSLSIQLWFNFVQLNCDMMICIVQEGDFQWNSWTFLFSFFSRRTSKIITKTLCHGITIHRHTLWIWGFAYWDLNEPNHNIFLLFGFQFYVTFDHISTSHFAFFSRLSTSPH